MEDVFDVVELIVNVVGDKNDFIVFVLSGEFEL